MFCILSNQRSRNFAVPWGISNVALPFELPLIFFCFLSLYLNKKAHIVDLVCIICRFHQEPVTEALLIMDAAGIWAGGSGYQKAQFDS